MQTDEISSIRSAKIPARKMAEKHAAATPHFTQAGFLPFFLQLAASFTYLLSSSFMASENFFGVIRIPLFQLNSLSFFSDAGQRVRKASFYASGYYIKIEKNFKKIIAHSKNHGLILYSRITMNGYKKGCRSSLCNLLSIFQKSVNRLVLPSTLPSL